MDHQNVPTVDIRGTVMEIDMESEIVHMKLEGKMTELLAKLVPKLYHKYMTNN